MFNLKSALKLDEVMSPNIPLRYGLSTADGYDGGVLPLHRFLDLASLLAPRSELRTDGVLRTRLIALPETRLLDLLGIRAVIANRVTGRDLDGIHYDVATARQLQDGDVVHVRIDPAVSANTVGLLGSTRGATPESTAHMTLGFADGSQQDIDLGLDAELFDERVPGPVNAPQPTAGLSREGQFDSAVRVPIDSSASLTDITWHWSGPGQWSLRAATLITDTGPVELVLDEGMSLTSFGTLELFRREPSPRSIPLLPRGALAGDQAALDALRHASASDLQTTVWLAPETVPDAASLGEGAGDATFEPGESSPEHLVFRRTSGDGSGYLMVPDAWFTGWTARVDGVTAPLYRADVLFKAVWVPPIAMQVELIYEPTSLKTGTQITMVSAAALAVLLLISFVWRRRREPVDHTEHQTQ